MAEGTLAETQAKPSIGSVPFIESEPEIFFNHILELV